MACPGVSSPMSASKTKQERMRDNQRRSRARRQEYIADLERRLRENHSTCRDADLQKSAFLDLRRENGYLRNLLMMAGVSSGVIDTFMHQTTNQHDQRGDELSSSGRQLKPKLHVLPSQSSEFSPTWSDESRATSAETSAISSIDPWHSTISRAGTHGLYSESDLCNTNAFLWGHENDAVTVAAQVDLNQFFNSLHSYNHMPAQEHSFLYCNTTLNPKKGPVFESTEMPCPAQWLRT